MIRVLVLFVSCFILFLFSACSEEENTGGATYSTSGMVVNVPNGVPQDVSTLSSLGRAENDWDFVRASATWGDANSQIVDELLTALLNSGLLQLNGTFTDTTSTINNMSVSIRLTTDQPTTVSTASAFTGSRTYDRKFEIWRNSDGAKGLELFFDSATELGTDGVLLYYQVNVLDPDNFDGDNVVVESFTQDTADGRKQTYTWSGGALTAGGPAQSGRVILEEMDNNTNFCFKSVIKLADQGCSTSADDYYSLGYTQRLDGSGEVTAMFGFADNSIDNSGTICGIPNLLNFGTFNSNGFISDANTSVASNFPETTRVTGLFGEINTAGAGAWDDLRQSTINGLNIQFVDNSPAP